MSLTEATTTPIARDARSAAAVWRPQRFSESGGDVADPIIEPLWTGLRVLGHVEGGTATFRDLDGDPVEEFPDVATELAAAILAERCSSTATSPTRSSRTPGVVARRDAEARSADTPTMSQMWFGNIAPAPSRETRQPSSRPSASRRLEENDVALVVVDLLWLDDEPLLDVPLLERKRILESVVGESRLVRRGTFVRPPVDPWLGSWRAFGFSRMSYKAANSRYLPGQRNPDWTVADVPAR